MVRSAGDVGRRLLPHIVDEYRESDPEKLAASFQVERFHWHDVTYSELSKAVDFTAHHIDSHFGRSTAFETLAFLGVPDIRYTVVFLAAMKCQYTILALSPRNSIDDHTRVLETNNCQKFLYTKELEHAIANLAVHLGEDFSFAQLDSYDDIVLRSKNQEPYAYPVSYSTHWDKPAISFQTSGTTGTPKAITLNHGWLAATDNWQKLPAPEGRVKLDITLVGPGERFLNLFPAFHGTGATFNIFASIFFGIVPCTLAPGVPVNEDSLISALNDMSFAAAIIPPSVLEGLAVRTDAEDAVKKLKYIFFGAGPLSYKAGDILAPFTSMVQLFGGTEIGLVSSLRVADWKHFEFNPAMGLSLEQVDNDDVYEIVYHRNPVYEEFHPVFRIFPDLQVWRTRDLFRKVPGKEGYWMYEGRTDDTIVLGNAEKFNPSSLENVVQSHSWIRSAICFGQGRFQIGMLVEPEYSLWTNQNDPRSLIEAIWPLIEKQNEISSGMGRLQKEMILMITKDKPLVRAAKGSIIKRSTFRKYAEEIDALYNSTESEMVPLPSTLDADHMRAFVRKCFTISYPSMSLEDDDDFFKLGVDSLQAMTVARILQASIKAAPVSRNNGPTLQQLSVGTIYQNPSISQLSSYLSQVLQAGCQGNISITPSRQMTIDAMVEKFSSGMASLHTKRFILTGSTGSLGSYMLHHLLTQYVAVKVYCLNRGGNARQRTADALKERGLCDISSDGSRVEFVEVHYGQPLLGLSKSIVQNLQTVDAAILNAWPVNFVQSLQSFEPHIGAVRDFIDMSVAGWGHMHIFYISSIGAVAGLTNEDGYSAEEGITETLFLTGEPAARQGYGESKQAVERLLASASKQAGISCTIARVGQVAGPTSKEGRWNDAEWLPSIIKTSKALRKIPYGLGSMEGAGIDWIPVDLMSETAIQLLKSRLDGQQTTKLEVFHLVNPQKSKWKDLAPAVQDYYHRQGLDADLVSFEVWLEALRKHVETKPSISSAEQMPALKLLDFFTGAAEASPNPPFYQTAKTQRCSTTLARMKAIDSSDLSRWLKQWNY